MSNFFGKLVSRHQQRTHKESAAFVEPRPKSRFEVDSIGAAGQGAVDEVVSTAVDRPSAETTHSQPHGHKDRKPIITQSRPVTHLNEPSKPENVDRPKPRLRSNRSVDHLAERVNALSQQLKQDVSVDSPTVERHATKVILQNDKLPKWANKETRPNLVASNELDQHIQSLRQRLYNESTIASRGDSQPRLEQPESFAVPQLDQQSRAEPVEATQVHREFESNSSKLNNDGPLVQTSDQQSGLPQPPSWLSDMHSEISQRWQDINKQTQPPEPVVNVTIGRVEVKAVQESAPQQPRKKKKLSGVMSLDDYLKERA